MYRYLRYVSILLFTVFRKVFGLVWYFIAAPFRRYARNVVYNYVLQNGIYLKRLLERPIERAHHGWVIKPFHGSDGGYIKHRKVSWLKYQLVYWLIWGWLDDDSFCDTSSESFMKEWEDGTRGTRDNTEYLSKCNGNAFDRGDALEANWCGVMAILWNVRNTAYNFKYMQWEENRPEMLFYHKIGSLEFGYNDTGRLVFGGN